MPRGLSRGETKVGDWEEEDLPVPCETKEKKEELLRYFGGGRITQFSKPFRRVASQLIVRALPRGIWNQESEALAVRRRCQELDG